MPDGLHGSINARTRLCAVFGHPVHHSASPPMQNAGISELKLNWRYVGCEVLPEELKQAIDGAKTMGFIGLNLTVPHKMLAMDMVDVIDPRAKSWGAVNTIVFEGRTADGNWKPVGQLNETDASAIRSHGYNTDGDALVRSVQEVFGLKTLQGASVLLLGAGGAAQSAALRLAEAGVASLNIVNRTQSKAMELAETTRRMFGSVRVSIDYPTTSVDVVINATSLGLKTTDALPIDLAWTKSRRPAHVYDMIYRPKETPLLAAAREIGSKTSNGLSMLLYQGAAALQLWSGMEPPIAIMRTALEKNVHG